MCKEFTPGKVLERFGSGISFVVIQNSVVAGTATLKGDEVGSVFVCLNLHGRGVGRMLMEHLEAVAGQNGVRVLKAHSSLAAADFYLRLGYRRLGEKYEPDGEVTVKIQKYLKEG